MHLQQSLPDKLPHQYEADEGCLQHPLQMLQS